MGGDCRFCWLIIPPHHPERQRGPNTGFDTRTPQPLAHPIVAGEEGGIAQVGDALAIGNRADRVEAVVGAIALFGISFSLKTVREMALDKFQQPQKFVFAQQQFLHSAIGQAR